MRRQTIETIGDMLGAKSPWEKRHARNVSVLAAALAGYRGYSPDRAQQLRTAGMVHDIGKIALSDEILTKNAALSEEEWQEVRRHAEVGYRILSTSTAFADVAEDVLAHHEWWDGSGYPKGLRGEKIPENGRILHIAEAMDTMVCQKGFDLDQVLTECMQMAGKQFDPSLVRLVIDHGEALMALCSCTANQKGEADHAMD